MMKRALTLLGSLLAAPVWADAPQPAQPAAVATQAAASSQPGVPSLPPCGQLDDNLSTRLALARQTLQSGKGYATLAYLDALNSRTPEAQLVRADANRRIGRLSYAEPLYQQLRSSCLSGYAYHGLGLIESARGRMEAARAHLERAQALLPLYAPLRNDLGFLYMRLGRFDDARHAYMTAIELDPSDRRPLNNLVLAHAKRGELVLARQLAEQAGMSAADLDTLLAHAAQPAPAPPTGDTHETTLP